MSENLRLGQLVDLRKDKKKFGKDPTKPYVGLEDMGSEHSGIRNWRPSTTSTSVNSLFRQGDVLFGKLRPELRKCESASTDGYCSTDILVLRPKVDFDPGYVGRVFQSTPVSEAAIRTAEGTGMPRASWRALSRFEVPRHPIAEQRKIAEILDTVDELIRSAEHAVIKSELLQLGLVQSSFPDVHRPLPDGWKVLLLEDCCASEITYGIVQAGPHMPNGVPYIRTGDMTGDGIDHGNLLRTSPSIAASYARSTVRAGDIVCAIRATVGKVLPVPKVLDGANLTQGTAKISPRDGILPGYLLWALRSPSAVRQFKYAVKGTTFVEIPLPRCGRS